MVNPSNVESLPGLAPEDPELSFEAADLRKALWAVGRCPELAYAPKSHQFTCSLLERLNCYVNDIPLIRTKEWTKEGWMLNPKAQKSWHMLELALHRIINILTAASASSPEVQFRGIEPFWSPPTQFGYLKVHSDSRQARQAIKASRTALIVLAARCSMMIALVPDWKRILERSGVPHEWMAELRQSSISEFRIGTRTGAFLNPRPGGTPWMTHLPCMVRAKLPVYISWGMYENNVFDCKEIDKLVREQPLVKPYTPDFNRVWVVPDLGDPIIVSNPRPHAI